jgi:hypothetical protein
MLVNDPVMVPPGLSNTDEPGCNRLGPPELGVTDHDCRTWLLTFEGGSAPATALTASEWIVR